MNFIPASLLSDMNKLEKPSSKLKKDPNPMKHSSGEDKLKSELELLSQSGTSRKLRTRGSKVTAEATNPKLPKIDTTTSRPTSKAEGKSDGVSEPAETLSDQKYVLLNTKVISTIPDNGYQHPNTLNKVGHLIQKDPFDGINVLYDINRSPGSMKDSVTDPDPLSRANVSGGGESRQLTPNELNVLSLQTGPRGMITHFGAFPSLKPATRKEVTMLKQSMIAALKHIGVDEDVEYPTEMHALLTVVQKEQKIYDSVFSEIIRQVTINMTERGEMLAELRRRYATLFSKIPKQIIHVHTELVIQRKLNKRLTEELLRSRDTTSSLLKELESVRRHDLDVSKQAAEDHDNLLSLMTDNDDTDDVLDEYHKLYRLQKERLEETIRVTEQEKRLWMDAARSLALRIGKNSKSYEITKLQKFEYARVRATNHMIVEIYKFNNDALLSIEGKIQAWRDMILNNSQAMTVADTLATEVITKIQFNMKMILRTVHNMEPIEQIEHDAHLLKNFHVYDVKSMLSLMTLWLDQMSEICVRFTPEKGSMILDELIDIAGLEKKWLKQTLEFLHRNERNTFGRDYTSLMDKLNTLAAEIKAWMQKLNNRITGEEDGLPSNMISLQNSMEDYYTFLTSRDPSRPLNSTERNQLKELFTNWDKSIDTIILSLSNNAEQHQLRIPEKLNTWLKALVEQVNTATDIRNEENAKMHSSAIAWMIQLLVKSGKEGPSEAWDREFHNLHQELVTFNSGILQDSADINIESDEGSDLKQLMKDHCEHWTTLAKRLLIREKEWATKRIQDALQQRELPLSDDEADVYIPEDPAEITGQTDL